MSRETSGAAGSRMERRLTDEQFRALALAHAEVFWLADSEGRLRDAGEWSEFTGQDVSDAVGWGWLECVHPEDRPAVEESWQRSQANREPIELEYRVRHHSGGFRFVRDLVSPVLDEQGEVHEWVGVVMDITERRVAEEAQARLAAIVMSTDDAIVSKDLDGIITSWNPGAERIFGYSAREAVGKPITIIIPPERLDEEEMIIGRLRRGERIEHFETVRRRKDGALRDISLTVSPIRDPSGRVIGASKVARDVTERKRSEEALRRHAQALETIYAVATSVAGEFDVGRLARTVIAAGLELSGAEFGFFYELAHEGSFVALASSGSNTASVGAVDIASLLDSSKAGHGTVLVEADGRRFLASPLVSRSDEVLGALLLGRAEGEFAAQAESAVSALAGHAAVALDNLRFYESLERKVAERTLELSDLNDELSSFNYSVSHDLRAPLRGIEGFSRVLLQDYGELLDDAARHYLERICAGTERMGRLIDDLLDLSRLSRKEVRPQELDLGELAREVLADLLEGDRETQVEVVIDRALPVSADPGLLRLALTNLLENALKFTRPRKVPRIEVGCSRNGGSDEYYVRDNGVGFDVRFYDKLFAPFQRLHSPHEFEGTGIGLAIVQRVIKKHGGRLRAEGEPGRGATFYFTLPTD